MTDFDELYRNELLPSKISLDRYYAKRRCLALDLRILVWTVVAVIAGARVNRNELTRAVHFEKTDDQEARLGQRHRPQGATGFPQVVGRERWRSSTPMTTALTAGVNRAIEEAPPCGVRDLHDRAAERRRGGRSIGPAARRT